jgi:hypothetical protein
VVADTGGLDDIMAALATGYRLHEGARTRHFLVEGSEGSREEQKKDAGAGYELVTADHGRSVGDAPVAPFGP